MAAHLRKTTVEDPLFPQQHLIHRGRHVVIDAPLTAASKKGKGTVMRIKHHLQRLTGIGHHKALPAVAQSKMRYLRHLYHPVEDHPLVAPVKLVRLTRGKAQRYEACTGIPPLLLTPLFDKALDTVVAAAVAFAAE